MVFPPIRYLSLAGGAVLAAGALAALLLRSKPIPPEEIERLRREYLQRHGRILDGTILDFCEVPDSCRPDANPRQLLTFSYEISGVQYEAAQDVTDLRQYVDVHECRLGLPASIRYDPHHPENSMVVSEEWSGLRHGAMHPKIARITGAAARELAHRPNQNDLLAHSS